MFSHGIFFMWCLFICGSNTYSQGFCRLHELVTSQPACWLLVDWTDAGLSRVCAVQAVVDYGKMAHYGLGALEAAFKYLGALRVVTEQESLLQFRIHFFGM